MAFGTQYWRVFLLLICLAFGAVPAAAGHLGMPESRDFAAERGGQVLRGARDPGTARAALKPAERTVLRGARPSPRARFMRDPTCGTACLPPGQLLDFGLDGETGPPVRSPIDPEPPLIVTPLPPGAVLLVGGLAILAAFGRRRRWPETR